MNFHSANFAKFFVVVGLLLSMPLSAKADFAGKKSGAAHPNILWIITDDLGVELGCYGEALTRTPNLDRLAKQGARYTRCFTTAPVCSPSRSAIMTGMYQTTINAHDHRSMTELPAGVKPITEYFRQAGYFTANMGKIPGDYPASHDKTDFNFKVEKPFDSNNYDDLKTHQPFFAEIQIFEPHRGSWKPGEAPEFRVNPDKVKLPPYYPDTPAVREDWARYLSTINYLDTKVGKILQRLEQDGLATNTIVFFFSDNGRCHVRDKQWPYEGGLHIPLIVRPPSPGFGVAGWPGKIKAGTVKDDLVSSIDISATSLKLAGATLPKNIQGQIFLGEDTTKRKYIFGARDRCDETIDRIRSVRDDRYKYIRNFMPELPWTQKNNYKDRSYPALKVMRELHAQGKLTPAQELFMADRKPDEELYDLKTDADELHNLANSPKHQKKLNEFRDVLQKWMAECDDRPDKHGEFRK